MVKRPRKFEMCYVLARESLAFVKYPAIHALSEHFGNSYKTANCTKLFTHFIVESQRKSFLQHLVKTKIVSFIMDGSMDSGNLEQEVYFVVIVKRMIQLTKLVLVLATCQLQIIICRLTLQHSGICFQSTYATYARARLPHTALQTNT